QPAARRPGVAGRDAVRRHWRGGGAGGVHDRRFGRADLLRRALRPRQPRAASGGIGMSREFTWDGWVKTLDVPLYRGYYIPDLRTLELGWWERRGCHTAFVQLAGQEGICEARVSEIPPGGSLPPFQLAIDEVVYILSG